MCSDMDKTVNKQDMTDTRHVFVPLAFGVYKPFNVLKVSKATGEMR